MITKLLKKYTDSIKGIYEYFGYTEEWHVYPLEDLTECYWTIHENAVWFGYENNHPSLESIENEYMDSYKNSKNDEEFSLEEFNRNFIENEFGYKSIILKEPSIKETHSMICVDTQCDGNKFLTIFDNKKRFYPKMSVK